MNCTEHPLLTVVIATLGKSVHLRDCVQSVAAQGCERMEIVVVLSASCSDQHPALEGMPVRVISLKDPGVSLARNTGISRASGEILAFLDDDVLAKPGWAHAILRGFADPQINCVTGRVIPEGSGYMPPSRYTSPRTMSEWTLSNHQRGWVHDALSVDTGLGCNMAFRRSFLDKVPFPVHLGAGSLIGCADEVYMFFQVVQNGLILHHTPSSVVTHCFDCAEEQPRERLKRIHAGNVAFHLRMMTDFPRQRWAFFRELILRGIRAARYGANAPGPQAMTGFTAREKVGVLLSGIRLFWEGRRALHGHS